MTGSARPADQDAKNDNRGDPQADLPARVVPVALCHVFSQAGDIRAVFSLHGLHALLEDGEFPGKPVSVRRAAHGGKLRAAGLPGQEPAKTKLVEVVLLVYPGSVR